MVHYYKKSIKHKRKQGVIEKQKDIFRKQTSDFFLINNYSKCRQMD